MGERNDHSRDQLLDILAFYRESGVDVCLSEEPVDRTAPETGGKAAANLLDTIAAGAVAAEAPVSHLAEPSRQTSKPATAMAPEPVDGPAGPSGGRGGMGGTAAPAILTDDAGMAARELAGEAQTLDELRAMLEAFEGCGLKKTATNLVFADGNPDGRVMFVGEAPGRDEDRMGLPFVGRSGQLLDRMLAAIGLDRKSVYIANTVPWRPPGNRTPTPEETEICRPFIERQITLADPDILVPLGSPSAKMLFRTSAGITRVRGQWRGYQTEKREIRAMATLHPAYLLRQPLQKRLAWRDFLALKRELEGR